jgi:hypothetical protein
MRIYRTRIRDRFSRTRSAMLLWWCNLIIILFTNELLRGEGTYGPNQTAKSGTVMLTTYVGLKTFYVRDRTGELRPITTTKHILSRTSNEVSSGKALNRAEYPFNIELFWMKIQRKQECIQSMTERYANPNHGGKFCKSRSKQPWPGPSACRALPGSGPCTRAVTPGPNSPGHGTTSRRFGPLVSESKDSEPLVSESKDSVIVMMPRQPRARASSGAAACHWQGDQLSAARGGRSGARGDSDFGRRQA